MQEQLRGRETGSFICENEPRNIPVYASFLVNYLYSTKRVTYDDRLALQTALMELRSRGIFRLDGVILTHLDADHAGGVEYLLSVMRGSVQYPVHCG